MCEKSEVTTSNPSISSAGDSHVRTSHSQGRVPVLKGKGRVFGGSFIESLASYDPDTSSLRMFQLSLFEEGQPSLDRLPRSGSMLNGIIYQQHPSAPLTGEIVSSLWLGTPTATMSVRSDEFRGKSKLLTPAEMVAELPSGHSIPTPTASDSSRMPNAGRNSKGPTIHEIAEQEIPLMWPTPTASDHIQWKTSKSWKAQGRVNYVLSNPEVTGVTGGQLNPTWVEWLMGFPLGWTDLRDSETP